MPNTAPAQSPKPAKSGRRSAKDTLREAKDSALDRVTSTVEGLEQNPIGVLVGGLAFGLVAGAFVPRSKREQKLLRPVGKRIATGAAAAVAAAKATGKEQFSSALMSRDTAKEGARKVLDSALKAAKGGKSTRDA